MGLTNLLHVSLAYKAAVAQLMLGEANFYANKLGLPLERPITISKVAVSVNPPPQALGHLATKDFVFSFPGTDRTAITNEHGGSWFLEPGKLAYLMRLEPFRKYGTDVQQIQLKLAKEPCLITTNDAYRLATQWLAAVSVDIGSLERYQKPLVLQQEFYDPPLGIAQLKNPPKGARKLKLPIFDVSWGGTSDVEPPVWVEISGVTRELILLRMGDTRFSMRSPLTVSNAFELNTRPDPPDEHVRFQKGSGSNLNHPPPSRPRLKSEQRL